MKIFKNGHFIETNYILDFWNSAAVKISMEYGVYVKVVHRYFDDILVNPDEEICFSVGGREFGSLRDLRRALKNKAFL